MNFLRRFYFLTPMGYSPWSKRKFWPFLKELVSLSDQIDHMIIPPPPPPSSSSTSNTTSSLPIITTTTNNTDNNNVVFISIKNSLTVHVCTCDGVTMETVLTVDCSSSVTSALKCKYHSFSLSLSLSRMHTHSILPFSFLHVCASHIHLNSHFSTDYDPIIKKHKCTNPYITSLSSTHTQLLIGIPLLVYSLHCPYH